MPKTLICSCKPFNRNEYDPIKKIWVKEEEEKLPIGIYENNGVRKPQKWKYQYINRAPEFSEIRKREINFDRNSHYSSREALHDYRNSVDKMISFSFISKILSV